MPAAVSSAFDVAFWLIGRARLKDETLQPLRLQQLMFIAQGWFAALNGGRAMMPAVFVADELGPIEPNIYAAFSRGCPDVDCAQALPLAVEAVLDRVWRAYGNASPQSVAQATTQSLAYQAALAHGQRAAIPIEDICAFFADAVIDTRQGGAAARQMRTQDGRSVRVVAWTPTAKSSNE
jgi:uncharacterized phage-associated protein